MARALDIAVLCLVAIAQVEGIIILGYSISRHGARNALPKTILLQETAVSDETVSLLPLGQRMCYNAGRAYAARYVDPTTCAANTPRTCLFNPTGDISYGLVNYGAGYNNYNTKVRSSSTDRTLLSALSFLSGVFPANASAVPNATVFLPTGQQIVPVYSTDDDQDWLIRSYTKCTAFDNRLLAWYQSPEFLAKSAATQNLRDYIGSLNPGLDVSLDNWWNVYDPYNSYVMYGLGDPLPTLNATIFNAMRDLAYWAETRKGMNDLTGNLLGGPLLSDIIAYMDDSQTALSQGISTYYRMLHISSHYNVQLGVFGALALNLYPPAVAALNWLNATLPQLASMVVFELHAADGAITVTTLPSGSGRITATGISSDDLAVRLVVQQGPTANYTVVPLPCAVAGDAAEKLAGVGACTYTRFRQLASGQALGTAQAWCGACSNNNPSNTEVSACLYAGAAQELAGFQANQTFGGSDGGNSSDDSNKWKTGMIVGICVTFAGTLAISAGVFGYLYLRAKHQFENELALAKPLTSAGPSTF